MVLVKVKDNDIVFLFLGGVGEIGMNFGFYGFGFEGNWIWLIVDCGVSFVGFELLGIDFVLLDIKFLEDEVDNIVGMVIIYVYEDYYGVIVYLWFFLKVLIYVMVFIVGFLVVKVGSELGVEEILVMVVW